MPLNPIVAAVTDRIRKRSAATRHDYLRRMAAARVAGTTRGTIGCTNLAHAFAASDAVDKDRLRAVRWPNIGIVSAYNDMLSAHQPLERFPAIIKQAAREAVAVAQFAGGVPAMCDGVTQGEAGMELSLFSRDVIAMATAVALSHNTFDAVLCLGVCDKIVPGLMIGALSFGHLPVIFVPGGPMPSGLPNADKAKIRQLFAQGKVDRDALLESEAQSYHAPGTCTFYGTANSNQMLMEVMGVHLPGAAFVNPNTPLRDALTVSATKRVAAITALGKEYTPLCEVIDERAIVNGIVGLHATGGSTNHTIHLVAMARAAGVIIDWDDFDELSGAVPLLTRIYPNGSADVNHFHAAGGMGFLVRELLSAGLLHEDVRTVAGQGLSAYAEEPFLEAGGKKTVWRAAPSASHDASVLRPVTQPFATDGGLRRLEGNLGRAVIKVSAVKHEHRIVEAQARVFDSQEEVHGAFERGELARDFVAVVRFQGPRANGMPEMHSLTPLLGMLQNQGRRVALVTDGRLSGASGKIPSAIHVTPEAFAGGPLARLRNGDIILLDGEAGVLEAQVDATAWRARSNEIDSTPAAQDMGRNLFAFNRAMVTAADQGAVSISCGPALPATGDADSDSEYQLGVAAALATHEAKDA